MKAGPLISDEQIKDSSPETGSVPVLPDITLRRPPLSRGPLSVVYTGWDKARRCHVIVKVQRATEDAVTRDRFGREAAAMERLRHPSIVALYAFHPGDPTQNDPAALVMEYVPGQTLAALVTAAGFLPPARAVQIIEEIAAALDCVHGAGIVHRDVKPSNILVPKRGQAKLTDFGVARLDDDAPLTVMGDILGTIEYASPEQVHGKDTVDTRSDVYSLAAVSYFALTGTPPFRAADASTQAQLSVMHRQVFADPPPLRLHRAELAPDLEAAVLRGLAKAPDARYESAGQLAAALRAAVTASGEPQQAAAQSSARLSGAVAGLLSAVLLITGFSVWMLSRSAAPSPDAPAAPTVASKPVPSAPQPTAQAALPPLPLVPPPVKSTRKPPLSAALPPPTVPRRAASVPPAARPTAKRPAPRLASVRRRQVAVPLPSVRKTVTLPVRLATRPAPKTLPQTPPILSTSGVLSRPSAAAAKPVIALMTPPLPTPPAIKQVGWYTVSGWIALARQSSAPLAPAQNAALVQASPLWIKVDGQPFPALAAGQWAELPAGTHTITYQPSAGYGVGPKTWTITLAPAGHLSQQIPLPPAPLPAIPVHLRNP